MGCYISLLHIELKLWTLFVTVYPLSLFRPVTLLTNIDIKVTKMIIIAWKYIFEYILWLFINQLQKRN